MCEAENQHQSLGKWTRRRNKKKTDADYDCDIQGFHDVDYEQYCLLGGDAV